MASFSLEREVAAPPQVVFDVLTDHRGYAEITPVRSAELEREGEPAPNGVGAIRALGGVGPTLREEVLAYDPPSRFSYTVISGLPVRDHVGTVSLAPVEGGTRLVYVVRTIPTLRLGGRAVVAGTRQAVRLLINGVAGEAERRAAGA